MRKLLIVGIATLFAATAFAADIGGVKLADKVAVGGQELVLNGGGGSHQGHFQGVRRQPLPAGQGGRSRRRAGEGPAAHPDEPAARPFRRPAPRRAERRAQGQQHRSRTRGGQGAVRRSSSSIMKSFGEVKEGNVVTLDFVDGATVVGFNGAAKGTIPGRGVQSRADEDLARRQARAGGSQEGDAGRLIRRGRACRISGPRAATGCSRSARTEGCG